MSEPKRMSMDELRNTREYVRLTERQKMFVETYCSAGLVAGQCHAQYDAVVATLLAYRCKDEEVARIMSYALMANIRIVAVLNRHFGDSPIDSFLKTLERAIANKKLTIAQLQALKLYCDVMGFATGIPSGHFGAAELAPAAPPALVVARTKKPKKIIVKPLPSSDGSSYDLSRFEK